MCDPIKDPSDTYYKSYAITTRSKKTMEVLISDPVCHCTLENRVDYKNIF